MIAFNEIRSIGNRSYANVKHEFNGKKDTQYIFMSDAYLVNNHQEIAWIINHANGVQKNIAYDCGQMTSTQDLYVILALNFMPKDTVTLENSMDTYVI